MSNIEEVKKQIQEATKYAIHAFCGGSDYNGGNAMYMCHAKEGDFVKVITCFEGNGQVHLFSFKQTQNALEIIFSAEVNIAIFRSAMGAKVEDSLTEAFLKEVNASLSETTAKSPFLKSSKK